MNLWGEDRAGSINLVMKHKMIAFEKQEERIT